MPPTIALPTFRRAELKGTNLFGTDLSKTAALLAFRGAALKDALHSGCTGGTGCCTPRIAGRIEGRSPPG